MWKRKLVTHSLANQPELFKSMEIWTFQSKRQYLSSTSTTALLQWIHVEMKCLRLGIALTHYWLLGDQIQKGSPSSLWQRLTDTSLVIDAQTHITSVCNPRPLNLLCQHHNHDKSSQKIYCLVCQVAKAIDTPQILHWMKKQFRNTSILDNSIYKYVGLFLPVHMVIGHGYFTEDIQYVCMLTH